MKIHELIEQVQVSLGTMGKFIPMGCQLIAQPSAFFWNRSRHRESRQREALEILAVNVVCLACLYYGVVASILPVKSLEVFFLATLSFNVANLFCMSAIYAALAKVSNWSSSFRLHLWNVLCTTPVLCIVALLTPDYSEAWTRQLVEGKAVNLSALAKIEMAFVVIGYLWVARTVYASLRHNNTGYGWFRAASVAAVGFAGTMTFLAFPLASGYARLLRVLVA